jgi:4-hydroxy-tetrahydrodipicolinate synthase
VSLENRIETGGEVTHPRVLTAMITPFHENGSLNHDGAQVLADYLVSHGSDGLVLAGTTGESPTLTLQNQVELFDVVRDAVGPDVPLIGGIGSNNTEEAVYMTKAATVRGSVDGLLAVSPYYNRPSQFGIKDYYHQIRNATNLPVTLYNIPVRTGEVVQLPTISALFEEGAINSVKDATGTTDMAKKLHRTYKGALEIYSGDDALNLEFAREAGAVGAISVASHWAGRIMGQMFTAHIAGDEELADRLQEVLKPSIQFESRHTDNAGVYHDTPNPIPTKVMMSNILGHEIIGDCLSPMLAEPSEMEWLKNRAAELFSDLQLFDGVDAV